jgi:uncharacterized DUF497 family protein
LKSSDLRLILGTNRITLIISIRPATEKEYSDIVLIMIRPDVILPQRRDICIGHLNTSSVHSVSQFTKRSEK